jgi:replicative DNA helicase
MSDQQRALTDQTAERAVLGAVVVNPELLSEAAGLLTPADFYRVGHRLIFSAMLRLDNAYVALDLVTLQGEMAKQGELVSHSRHKGMAPPSIPIAL